MSECERCKEIRSMSPDALIKFLSPLMSGQHWKLVAQGDRIRAIALRKHQATHYAADRMGRAIG